MRKVTVIGGDLYTLALLYLGDATQWVRIAKLNGLIDPELSGTVTPSIPSVDASATGGVYGA